MTRPCDPSAGEDSVFAQRDRYMAEAVTRLVDDAPGARVMVWAHNGHITASAPASAPWRRDLRTSYAATTTPTCGPEPRAG
ncbi:erythromycin esterase family protein [Streptomyces sp. NPDC048248]|uniref:erythromycin esterase family protein n=1 Tax=Streptomyces sp. NPDC048248 TaxID=3365523 RepID=UPI0037169B49